MVQVQILVGGLHRGHLGSTEVTNSFLLITPNWKELQTWAWSHCTRLVKPHRLICNMIYLGQHVTLVWGQILTWPFKVTMYMVRRALLRGSRWRSNFAASFLSSKVICKKKNVFAKNSYFAVFGPLMPEPLTLAQIWWYASERIAQELSNAVFRGLVAKMVSEITAHFRSNIWPLMTLFFIFFFII